ncbi:MAG: hypothetical protein M1819_004695 [Sarea resinae]|nr:MAG: hypothetical protein M1819_004695 [Sarea resinae]
MDRLAALAFDGLQLLMLRDYAHITQDCLVEVINSGLSREIIEVCYSWRARQVHPLRSADKRKAQQHRHFPAASGLVHLAAEFAPRLEGLGLRCGNHPGNVGGRRGDDAAIFPEDKSRRRRAKRLPKQSTTERKPAETNQVEISVEERASYKGIDRRTYDKVYGEGNYQVVDNVEADYRNNPVRLQIQIEQQDIVHPIRMRNSTKEEQA